MCLHISQQIVLSPTRVWRPSGPCLKLNLCSREGQDWEPMQMIYISWALLRLVPVRIWEQKKVETTGPAPIWMLMWQWDCTILKVPAKPMMLWFLAIPPNGGGNSSVEANQCGCSWSSKGGLVLLCQGQMGEVPFSQPWSRPVVADLPVSWDKGK